MVIMHYLKKDIFFKCPAHCYLVFVKGHIDEKALSYS